MPTPSSAAASINTTPSPWSRLVQLTKSASKSSPPLHETGSAGQSTPTCSPNSRATLFNMPAKTRKGRGSPTNSTPTPSAPSSSPSRNNVPVKGDAASRTRSNHQSVDQRPGFYLSPAKDQCIVVCPCLDGGVCRDDERCGTSPQSTPATQAASANSSSPKNIDIRSFMDERKTATPRSRRKSVLENLKDVSGDALQSEPTPEHSVGRSTGHMDDSILTTLSQYSQHSLEISEHTGRRKGNTTSVHLDKAATTKCQDKSTSESSWMSKHVRSARQASGTLEQTEKSAPAEEAPLVGHKYSASRPSPVDEEAAGAGTHEETTSRSLLAPSQNTLCATTALQDSHDDTTDVLPRNPASDSLPIPGTALAATSSCSTSSVAPENDENDPPAPAPKTKRRLNLHSSTYNNSNPHAGKKRRVPPKRQQTVQTTLSLAIGGSSGMRECKVCDTVYNPLHPEDVKVHAKRHAGVVRQKAQGAA